MSARPLYRMTLPRRRAALAAVVLAIGGTVAGASTAADGPGLAVGVAGQAVLEASAQTAFETALAEGFAANGFARVDSAWCSTPPCTPVGDHALALDVAVGAVRHAEIESGFAFTLGGPREAGRIEGEVVAIDCHLRTPGGRLVAARKVDQPVDPARLGDGRYLANRVETACAPLLDEQQVVVLAPATPRRRILPTADPEVFIEKRQVAADAPVDTPGETPADAAVAAAPAAATSTVALPAAAMNGAAATTTLAPTGSAAVAPDPAAPRLAREREGERTQYVLHNKGDTVILEFGQRR
ncbi:MAG: hypothetical protein AB7Q81_08610 [Gammaproteobacteria bacterium]